MSFSRRAFLRSCTGLLVPALFPSYASGLAKSDPEIFVQYVQGKKEHLIRVPLGRDLQVDGLITGIVVNRADKANLALLPDMSRLIPFDHPEWSRDNGLLLRSGIYEFDIHRAGLDNIGHAINLDSLTQGTFFSFYREPVTYRDFYLSVDDTRLSIDHQNPEILVKNIMYIGNKADKFYTTRREYLDILLKREQELSAFPNHNLPVIFNRFGVGAASLTREAIWIMPECKKKQLIPVYEHEQLHDITETTGLVGDLGLIDYYVSLIEEMPEANRKLLRRTLVENQGLSPYKIMRVGSKMQLFGFIDEKQYLDVPIETHPEHDVSEFATSYSHTLMYPEVTLQRLKEARQEIRLSYLEAGDKMLDTLRRDPQRAGGFLEFFGETFHWIKGRALA